MREQDSKAARHKTARQRDSETASQQDSKTPRQRQQDAETARRRDSGDVVDDEHEHEHEHKTRPMRYPYVRSIWDLAGLDGDGGAAQ